MVKLNRLAGFLAILAISIGLAACKQNKQNELKDPRDGKTYRTVEIGKQVWMAENLNYEMDGSYCYDNEATNCQKYGRLYTWAAAMQACPAGWHLPNNAEWKTLFKTVGSTSVAGKNLKSESGWDGNGNGTDEYGFSVLPAGSRNGVGLYGYAGEDAIFWSSTEGRSGGHAYHCYFHYVNENVHSILLTKEFGFSVRCLRD
ncbi:fibrobacter succinogenes major paralogous domain-containing protein [Fibrobacter intestinalis]|nr:MULTISPECIES: fibrobacter succinogenes major paralogous domain-containing protein [Fibrobacter]